MIRHHTLIYFASRLSSAAANLAAVAIFTRLAASHVYGGSLLVFSWTYVVFGFSGQWLGATFFAVQQPTAVPAQVATLGRLALAALTASALVVAAVAATGGVGWPFAGVVVVAVSAQLVFVTVTEVERTLLEAGRVSVMYLLRAALILAFGSIALLSGGGALDLALAISVANLLAALPGLIRLAPALIGPTDRATLASFVRYGWPLVLAFGAMGLGQNIDRLVLAHVAGTGSLGPYGATSDFLKQGFGVVCEAITLAAVSVAKDAATRGDRETARRLLEDSFRALVVTVAFGTVFILTFSNDFINVIFGPDFRATAHDLMPWLIAANAALVIRAFYFGQAIYFGQSSTNELLGAGSMIAVTAGLAFALVPGFGIYGAAPRRHRRPDLRLRRLCGRPPPDADPVGEPRHDPARGRGRLRPHAGPEGGHRPRRSGSRRLAIARHAGGGRRGRLALRHSRDARRDAVSVAPSDVPTPTGVDPCACCRSSMEMSPAASRRSPTTSGPSSRCAAS